MSENKKDDTSGEGGEGKTNLSRPGRLEIKKTIDAGRVRQSFPHGRSRSVTVEVKRKRTYAQDERGKMQAVKVALEEPPAEASVESVSDVKIPEQPAPEPSVPGGLTRQERDARVRAVRDAVAPPPPPSQPYPETVEPPPEKKPPATKAQKPEVQAAEEAPSLKEERRPSKKAKTEVRKPPPRGRSGGRRRSGKLTITQALDERERVRSLAAVRRAREREKAKQKATDSSGEASQKKTREIIIPETILVGDLANRMAARTSEVIKVLMKMGVMVTVNQMIDGDTAELVVVEFGHVVRRVSEADVEVGLSIDQDEADTLLPRSPVVTVMGHVDHGKTSLLDALRETDVVEGEAGGITQHIGAYQIQTASGGRITFLDTPGHEAFSAMRARGANTTDLVILVVAADDGIKAQTIEAINHAKAAAVPIIVAINKMDLPSADPDRVRNELLQQDLVVEEMGGEVLSVLVSAKKKTNLDKLVELVLLQAELLELTANPDRRAEGVVIEARMEKGRGTVATVLVQHGSLAVGDIVIAGSQWGRVRALLDDRGQRLQLAGPSMPVEILGLTGAPSAGDLFVIVDSEARAREVTSYRNREQRAVATVSRGSVEQMLSAAAAGSAREFPVVIKADVHGSAEAIQHSLEKLETEEVKVRVLHAGVGGISESDVTLAQASEALIIGFNVRASPQARELARQGGVEIRYNTIIYHVVDEVKAALGGMLSPDIEEVFLGMAQVRQIFNIRKIGRIAGCRVSEGMIRRGSQARLLRDQAVIYDGVLASLRREKEEAREVKEGYECGIGLENYNDVQEGDVIECYERKEIARTL